MTGIVRISIALLLITFMGIAGTSEAQVDCSTQTGNTIVNCGYTTDVTSWNLAWGDSITWTGADGDGSPGAASVDAFDDSGIFRASIGSSVCISGPSGPSYFEAGSFKVVSGGSGATTCQHQVLWYDNSCTVFVDSHGPSGLTVGSSWVRHASGGSTFGPLEAIIYLTCMDTQDFTVLFDDAVVADDYVPVELQRFTVE